jgi:hypothetical protein
LCFLQTANAFPNWDKGLMGTVCRQNILDGWLGNLREYLADLV